VMNSGFRARVARPREVPSWTNGRVEIKICQRCEGSAGRFLNRCVRGSAGIRGRAPTQSVLQGDLSERFHDPVDFLDSEEIDRP
jgi:hypothetical protein